MSGNKKSGKSILTARILRGNEIQVRVVGRPDLSVDATSDNQHLADVIHDLITELYIVSDSARKNPKEK